MKQVLILFLIILGATTSCIQAQTIPASRTVDWSLAGLRNGVQDYSHIVYVDDLGGDPSGSSANNTAFQNAINALNDKPGVISFGPGIYFFSLRLRLPDSIILRGSGAGETILRFENEDPSNLIEIKGSIDSVRYAVTENAVKGQSYLLVNQSNNFNPGGIIQLFFK